MAKKSGITTKPYIKESRGNFHPQQSYISIITALTDVSNINRPTLLHEYEVKLEQNKCLLT